jgi:hypothetical protein
VTAPGQPLADPVAEGIRIATAAAERDLPLRLLGGVAVAILCPSARRPPLRREYTDVDMLTLGSSRDRLVALMEELGYAPDREFNLLHGGRRLYFWDRGNGRQADAFLDEAELCHRIDFRDRIEGPAATLAPADLALLKLQVVETAEKDYLDLCAIFADHELTQGAGGVDVSHLASLTASDWGLWRTVGMVARRTEEFAERLPGFQEGELVAERLRELRGHLDAEPKSRSWKLRARVGDRKRWYQLPEEVH